MIVRSEFNPVVAEQVRPLITEKDTKAIVFLDIASQVPSVAEHLAKLFEDEAAGTEDAIGVLEIVGKTQRDQKAFSIDVFCSNADASEDERRLCKLYRVLVASSGATATGIDPRNVTRVLRKGLPPNFNVFLKEYGRLLRGAMSIADVNGLYHVLVNVKTYAKLVWRSESAEKASRDEKNRNLKDHFELLTMFFSK